MFHQMLHKVICDPFPHILLFVGKTFVLTIWIEKMIKKVKMKGNESQKFDIVARKNFLSLNI